jgi:hypothetical protein
MSGRHELTTSDRTGEPRASGMLGGAPAPCPNFGGQQSSLSFEVPKGSLVHLCAKPRSYVDTEKTIKVVTRHTLMTLCPVKDRADITFTEYLYH